MTVAAVEDCITAANTIPANEPRNWFLVTVVKNTFKCFDAACFKPSLAIYIPYKNIAIPPNKTINIWNKIIFIYTPNKYSILLGGKYLLHDLHFVLKTDLLKITVLGILLVLDDFPFHL